MQEQKEPQGKIVTMAVPYHGVCCVPGTVLHTLMMMVVAAVVVVVAPAAVATAITGHALDVHRVRYMHSLTFNHGKRSFMVPFFNRN